jgi:succinylglutamic semialdehyde dehydrogenase
VNSPGVWIGGAWREGSGKSFVSADPMTGDAVWQGKAASQADVDDAVAAGRMAFAFWAHRPPQARAEILKAFQAGVRQARDALAERISRETGKPLWESKQEADTLAAKVDNSLAAQEERGGRREIPFADHRGVLRHRPHGVLAVLGPFNLPAHLPHSHIIPALLAGNAVVFKPSEFAPGVAAFCADLWRDAGLPPGVLNLVQGGRETGEALARHAGIDGLLFTGSYRAGLALSRIFAETPGKILALELGGNNPLVVWEPQDLAKAAELIVQSAYLTSGQRCVCARRLILPEGGEGDELIEALSERIRGVISGAWNDAPEPFMGPLIHNAAADALLAAQDKLVSSGAGILIPAQRSARGPALVTPGLLDATQASNRPDEEFFGPLLQVLRVPDFEAAMVEANNTRFGLAAGLISSRRDLWERFLGEARAGVVNWNRPLTGASGKFPFGGVGQSSNHRPSAWSAADYCQYPVASLEADTGPEA